MTLLLDTSVLIDISHGIYSPRMLQLVKNQDVAIGFITYFEFCTGLIDKNEKNRKKLLQLTEAFLLINTTRTTAEIAAMLKARYASTPLHLADLLIAAQAIEHNFVLITKDNAFTRIQELQVTVV
jgi:predicted nucleic acid-binding protein